MADWLTPFRDEDSDWKYPEDETDYIVTLVGWAGPDFDDNLRAGLGRPLAWDRADDEES